jgi:hypothetical protein
MTHYKHLILGGDSMFVNKKPFFMMISRHKKLATPEMLKNQKIPTILAAIKASEVHLHEMWFQA